jgi:hypothetical protein
LIDGFSCSGDVLVAGCFLDEQPSPRTATLHWVGCAEVPEQVAALQFAGGFCDFCIAGCWRVGNVRRYAEVRDAPM